MLTLISAALAAAAPAPDAPATVPSTVAAIDACRAITGDDERLACFDRAAAAFSDARAKREVMVMDKAAVKRTRKSLFGFTLPSFKLFGGSDKDDDADDIKQIESKVASAAPFGYGYYTIQLEEGSTWETTEAVRSFTPRRGDKIKIRRSAFGYMANSGYADVRVRRVK